MPVLTDIKFNDVWSSQFKCIVAFTQYACRSVPTTRIFFETSHGKSKSDGLGGVVKGFATHEVNAREVIIRNPTELFEFCLEKLTIKDNPDKKKALLNRVFYFIPSREVDDYRRQLPVLKYKSVKGARSIHQVLMIQVMRKDYIIVSLHAYVKTV